MIKIRPDFYVSCPCCQLELRVRRSSGNGDPLWSDGFWGTKPREFCEYSSCPSCTYLFWIDAADRLSKITQPTLRDTAVSSAIITSAGWGGQEKASFDETALAVEDELFVQPANNRKLVAALQKGSLELTREHYLRKELWHRGNHPSRGIETASEDQITEEGRRSNLEWLLTANESLPSEDRDIVREAELMRELGGFDEAIERIEHAYLGGASRSVIIHTQAAAGNASVCVVQEHAPVVIY